MKTKKKKKEKEVSSLSNSPEGSHRSKIHTVQAVIASVMNRQAQVLIRGEAAVVPCLIPGSLLSEKRSLLVGDRVELEQIGESQYRLSRVLPRENTLYRGSRRASNEEVPIAANAEYLLAVVTADYLLNQTGFPEAAAIAAQRAGMEVGLFVSKWDFVGENARANLLEKLELYRSSFGFVFIGSACEPSSDLIHTLSGKTSVIVGDRDCGKTSLVRGIIGGLTASAALASAEPSAELSAKPSAELSAEPSAELSAELSAVSASVPIPAASTHSGKHPAALFAASAAPSAKYQAVPIATNEGERSTVSAPTASTHAISMCGAGDTFLIDTPGFRDFSLRDITTDERGTVFPEIAELADGCYFSSCTHVHEEGCKVLNALRIKKIRRERYDAYQKMSGDIDHCESKAPKRDYRHSACGESFVCKVCGTLIVPEGAGSRHRNHCPNCLSSVHVDEAPGDRASLCHGIMEPVSVWVRKGGEWAIIHRCRSCGTLSSNRIAADDNPALLMSIAVKPLAMTPFPLDKLDAMFTQSKNEDSL